MTARLRYDEMIRDEIGPWLRARDFKKKRNRFRRDVRSAWQVIDFQASQWGSRDDVRFTLNVSVGVPELSDGAAGDAQFQERIGALMGGEDHWWSVDHDTDTSALARELRVLLDERALPWLDRRASLDQLMALAREQPNDFPRYLLGRFAILLEEAGKPDLAQEVKREAT